MHGRCATERNRFREALVIDDALSGDKLSVARVRLWLAYASELASVVKSVISTPLPRASRT
jgi:hypothetical protein